MLKETTGALRITSQTYNPLRHATPYIYWFDIYTVMKRNINWKKFACYTIILNTYTCLSLLIWNALYRYTGVYCNDVASCHAIYNVITNCKFQTISSTKLTEFLLHRRYTCNRNWLNTEYDLVLIKKVAWHKHWYTFTTISLFKK